MISTIQAGVGASALCLAAALSVEGRAPALPSAVATDVVATSAAVTRLGDTGWLRTSTADGWFEFMIDVPEAGRYVSTVEVRAAGAGTPTVWIEDYVGNPDGRTYDITGPILLDPASKIDEVSRVGSPLNTGEHRIRVHYGGGPIELGDVRFDLLKPLVLTPATMVQRTEGENWTLVWSDEFDGEGTPDSTKWTADVGNWGWGNREPQYYTENRPENARQENGHLIIEARRDDMGQPWTSARLTTRGKISFQYGRIVFRAKVPVGDGTWAAGWLLGDDYRDELSWPYCGEVDVMEAVGKEIDDETGDGINHASCHTRAYYFKQGNHISNTLPVSDMGGTFHDYVMEWTPETVKMLVDGEHYYTYDKHGTELEWPFDRPQNIILNLAMGGGMGGDIDPELKSQKLIVDYVRVFGRQ